MEWLMLYCVICCVVLCVLCVFCVICYIVMHAELCGYVGLPTPVPLQVEVFISYGGLLMHLVGDPKKLQDLEVDSSVYLLVRKV